MAHFYAKCFALRILIVTLFAPPTLAYTANFGGPEPDSLSGLGHCKTVIVADTNCATGEIILSAFIDWTWTGVHQAVPATWSNGLIAHKISVVPPGTWSWDPGGTTCEIWHQYNSITISNTFFDGPIDINGPTAICPNSDPLELTLNVNGYAEFVSLEWNPPNPTGEIEPYFVATPGTYGITVTDAFGCSSSDQITIVQVPHFTPTITGPNTICPEGDTAVLSILNPGLYASFEWTSGETTTPLTVFEPGVYDVTATDSYGCTGVGAFSVQSGAVGPFAITMSSPTLCPGQVDTLRVVGGFASYVWSNNVTGISNIVNQAGTYTVTVTNIYGCIDSLSTTVLPLFPPNIQVANTPLCPGDSATLLVMGGNFPQYNWSSGQTTQSIATSMPGTYSVTVSGAGVCATSTSMSLDFAATPTALIAPPATLSCSATQIILDAGASSAGPNFPVSWTTLGGHFVSGDTTLSPIVDSPGIYILSILNSATGCVTKDTVVVSQDIIPPPANAGQPRTLTCAVQDFNIGPLPAPIDPSLLPAWATPDGNILSGNDTWAPSVNQPGTYIVTVTNAANGCTSIASVIIGQDIDAPTAQIEPPNLITCTQGIVVLDGSGSSNGAGFTYLWTTPNGIFAGALDAANSAASSIGLYNLLVTDTINGCTASASVTVSADVNIPVVSALPTSILTCLVTNTVIDATASSSGPSFQYSWTTPNGNILSGENTLMPTVNAPGTYTLNLLNTTNNCAATLAVVVNQDIAPPMANAGQNTMLNCAIPSIALDGSGSSVGANFMYNWTTADGNIVSGSGSLNPTVNMAGTYTLQVINMANGCTTTSSTLVMNDSNAPVANIAAPATLTCATQQTIIDATASTQIGNLTYVWSGGILTGQGTLLPTVDQPGIYTLSVTNNTNGCTAIETVTVLENVQPPVVNAGADNMLTCAVTTLGLEAQIISSFSQNIGYQWATPNGQILGGGNTASPSIGAPGTYLVTITDADNGCTGTDQLEIFEDVTPPTALLAPPQMLTCAQPQVTIDALGCTLGANFAYQWSSSPGGHFVSTQNMQLPVVDAPADYTLVITNLSNGCTQSASVTVPEDVQLPTAQAGPTVGLDCDTQTNILDGGGSSQGPNFTYTWSTINGQIISGDNTLNPSIGNPGDYVLTVLNTQNGCSNIDSVNVTEDVQHPVLAIAPPQTLTCVVLSAILNGSGTGFGNSPSIAWATANGNVVAGGTSLTPTVDAPGTYTLTVLNNTNGCSSSIPVTVEQDIQIPSVQVQPAPLLTCSVLQFALQSTVPAQANVAWTTANGHIVSGANTPNPTVDEPGLYQLNIVSTINGCTNSAQITVLRELNVPTGLHFNLLPPLCDGTPGMVTVDQVDGGIGPFAYSVDGGQTFFASEAFNDLHPGNYNLVIQDINGCEVAQPLVVPELLVPFVTVPPSFEIALGENQKIQATVPLPFSTALVDTVIWSPMEGLIFEGNSISQLLNPTAQPFSTTQYTVTIVTKEGCKSTARTIIRVDRDVNIYVPNIIWPEDPDGRNGTFLVFARDESIALIKKLQIFDRWGSLIFQNTDFRPNDFSAGWNGDYRGEPVNPAVFVWWVEVELVDGRSLLLKGDVTVLR